MVSFKAYITEGKYPAWVKVTVAALIIEVRRLSKQIENESDVVKQNLLISKQNTLIGYMHGINFATKEKSMLIKVRNITKNTR